MLGRVWWKLLRDCGEGLLGGCWGKLLEVAAGDVARCGCLGSAGVISSWYMLRGLLGALLGGLEW